MIIEKIMTSMENIMFAIWIQDEITKYPGYSFEEYQSMIASNIWNYDIDHNKLLLMVLEM